MRRHNGEAKTVVEVVSWSHFGLRALGENFDIRKDVDAILKVFLYAREIASTSTVGKLRVYSEEIENILSDYFSSITRLATLDKRVAGELASFIEDLKRYINERNNCVNFKGYSDADPGHYGFSQSYLARRLVSKSSSLNVVKKLKGLFFCSKRSKPSTRDAELELSDTIYLCARNANTYLGSRFNNSAYRALGYLAMPTLIAFYASPIAPVLELSLELPTLIFGGSAVCAALVTYDNSSSRSALNLKLSSQERERWHTRYRQCREDLINLGLSPTRIEYVKTINKRRTQF